MKYTTVSYYDEFHCIGGACEDSCCDHWEIDVDEESLKCYLHTKGDFGKRLKENTKVKQKQFIRKGSRCPFLNADNLCDIFIEMGEECLCETCTNFPRHIEEFDDRKEISLTMSCPEASRIMLAKQDKIHFVTKEGKDEDYGLKPVKEKKRHLFFGKKQENKMNGELFSILLEARERIYCVLQERNEKTQVRAMRVLKFGEKLQELYDAGDMEALRGFVRQEKVFLESMTNTDSEEGTKEDVGEWFAQIFNMYDGLETIKEEWKEILNHGMKCRYLRDDQLKFSDYMKEREYEFEHILVYYIYNYFLGASYDGDILTKVKMAVLSYLVVYQLDVAMWMSKKRNFTYEDQVLIAHAYSKEVEHSYNNYESLQLVLSAHPLLDVEHLMNGLQGL